MSISKKIGLSRGRLFDFQNCVSFVGEYSEAFSEKELSKAVKMLSVRFPVIASVIKLGGNGEAFLHTEAIEPKVEFLNETVDSFVSENKKQGLNFNNALFKFYVLNEKTLVIFSHTVVSDAKSLLFLAKELLLYYNKENVSVEPYLPQLFSSADEIPLEAESFVADRITEILNNDWLMNCRSFSFEDYSSAHKQFTEKHGNLRCKEVFLEKTLVEALNEKCKSLSVDTSSLVAFLLLKHFSKRTKLKSKDRVLNCQLDRRPYFVDKQKYIVGALNGSVRLEMPKAAPSEAERIKIFHKAYFKKFSECFNAFYNELFLSKLDPFFLDSMFFYKAKKYKGKPTKKLATLYGCEQKSVVSFASFNLNQRTWEKLSTFNHISVKEPHKSNELVSASLVLGEETSLLLEWENESYSEAEIDLIVEKILLQLNEFVM